MAKCVKCGLSSLTLKLDFDGLCLSCHQEKNHHLIELEKFFSEYCIVPNAQEEATKLLSNAEARSAELKTEADRIVNSANNTARSILDTASSEALNIREAARKHAKEKYEAIATERSMLTAQKLKAELDMETRQKALDVILTVKKKDAEEYIQLAVAKAQQDIAALYAAAAKNFADLAKVTATSVQKPTKTTVKEYSAKKKEGHSVLAIQLMPSEFKKRYKRGFVVLDLETTGLNRHHDRIIEIGAIKYDGNFRRLDRFSTFVNPKCSIPYAATSINGITNSMVKDAPEIKDILQKLLDFIGELPIVAHNADFDIAFIQRELNACNMGAHLYYVDTLNWSRKAYELDSYKLASIAEHLCIPNSNAHRAINDCETLGEVVEDMLTNH